MRGVLIGCGISVGLLLASCTSFNADTSNSLDGGADAEADSSAADSSAADSSAADSDAGIDASPCTSAVYAGERVTDGFICGVGACRTHLTGPACVATKLDDGGTLSPCSTAYPPEIPNNLDDDCNGVIDDGRPQVAASAGFECQSCAYGRDVQRLADGTLENKSGPKNLTDQRNNTDCINSALCKLPGPQWVRDVTYPTTCSQFCGKIGGTCKTSCSTSMDNGCKGAGIGSNLGTFAADYNCIFGNTPLTGNCDATFPGIIDSSSSFNIYCCCDL
jgi:hypothetical protein